ncbi:MAG: hypothetical protein Q8936_21475 [Bacillota bacterium]|nr:hypothetical protein [Bacillota bacterium]
MSSYIPPVGLNYRPKENDIDPVSLSNTLCRIVSFLQSKDPNIKLNIYNDWWQHDGLHFEKGLIGYDDLFDIIETPRTIFENMPGDDWVYIGVSSEVNSWYLRFYLDWNRNDEHLLGRFDITVPLKMGNEFENEVISKLDFSIKKEDSKSYYERIILKS